MDSKLRPSVRCVCVLWMVEYSVLVCNSLGVLKAGRVTSVWWRKCDEHGREEKGEVTDPVQLQHGRGTNNKIPDGIRFVRDSDEPSRLKTFEKNTAVQTN